MDILGDKPITRIDLLNKIEEGEEAILKDEVISQEDLIQESENW